MKISYNWLCELIPGLEKQNPVKLAHQLTMSGLEVEASEELQKKYAGFVVGEVLSLEQHPDAEKLKVCQVSVGSDKKQVVCGAPNVEIGQKYPFAGVGVVLPEGMQIKSVKLRGVESFGMLCSERELGLSEAHEGLMVLDPKSQAGEDLASLLKINDVILEVNVTPNRGDALSHWGLAADIAAMTGLGFNADVIVPEEANLIFQSHETTKSKLKITHIDQKACGRFTGSEIFGVKIEPSPEWLKNRLESLGIRSINNVVDATNYVLMLTGHPVHTYDSRNITDHEIKIYSLDAEQKYKTLDSLERELLPGDLVIADAKEPVGLAGIMGGENSEVKDDTSDLILEVAFFDPDTIRKTSRRLGLQTESSYRFARFVNPDSVLRAHEILRDLILALAGGTPSDIIDSYPIEFKPVTVSLTDQEVTRILGITVEREDVLRILKGLRCEVIESKDGYSVVPPIGRSDLTRTIDLIEEIARIHGLDKIPAVKPRLVNVFPKESCASKIRQMIKDSLLYRGFQETIHYSFGDPSFMKKVLRPESTEHWIQLQNYLSEDLAVMRPSLLPHLLQSYIKNYFLTQQGMRLFELRNVYSYKQKTEIAEKETLAFLYAGNPFGRNRFDQKRESDFYDGLGLLEDLFHTARISVEVTQYGTWPFHPGQAASFVHEGQCLAKIGALHPQLLGELKIREKVYYGELDFEAFSQSYKQEPLLYKAISSLPSVYRDLSLVVPKALTYKDIVSAIEEEKPELLHDYDLFDVFEGEKMGAENKSITLSMTYEPKAQNLTDEEVNEVHFKLVESLKKRLGVSLR